MIPPVYQESDQAQQIVQADVRQNAFRRQQHKKSHRVANSVPACAGNDSTALSEHTAAMLASIDEVSQAVADATERDAAFQVRLCVMAMPRPTVAYSKEAESSACDTELLFRRSAAVMSRIWSTMFFVMIHPNKSFFFLAWRNYSAVTCDVRHPLHYYGIYVGSTSTWGQLEKQISVIPTCVSVLPRPIYPRAT